jgi:hypothetical protein
MTLTKPLIISIIFALGLTAHAARAHAQAAQFPRTSANACNPTSPSTTTFGRGLLGFYNSSTTANVSVTCVLPINGSSLTTATTTVNTLRVYYNDSNGLSGKAVQCTAYVRNAIGNGFAFGTRYSCATAGGCTSSGNTFTGVSYLEFSTPNSVTDASEVLVMCTVPPIQSGISVSALLNLTAALTVL